jgi:hypothetical protein
MTIEISYAKYNGTNGRKEVGIAAWRLPYEGVITQVRITQTYKKGKIKGKLIYPTLYCMPTEKIVKYPTQVVSNNTLLYIVPLDDFSPRKFDSGEPQHYQKAIAEKPVEAKVEQGRLILNEME